MLIIHNFLIQKMKEVKFVNVKQFHNNSHNFYNQLINCWLKLNKYYTYNLMTKYYNILKNLNKY